MNMQRVCVSFFILTAFASQSQLISMKSLSKSQNLSRKDSRQRKTNTSFDCSDSDKMIDETCLKCPKQHRSIFHAISHGCMLCVVFFVTKDGDEKINSNVWRKRSPHYPLEKACQEGHFDIAEFLLTNGAKLRKRSNHTQQLLKDSLHYCNIVKLLIKRCSEIELRIDFNDLLYAAVEQKHEETACFLINEYKNDSKALLEAKGERSSPLIVIAAQHRLKDVTALLCKKFKNSPESVDEPDYLGLTALYYALQRGDDAIFTILIQAGAKFARIPKAVEIGYNPKLAQLLDSAFEA